MPEQAGSSCRTSPSGSADGGDGVRAKSSPARVARRRAGGRGTRRGEVAGSAVGRVRRGFVGLCDLRVISVGAVASAV